MRNRLIVPAVLLAAIALSAQTTSVVELTAEPHHHLVLENEQVRVFLLELKPGDFTLMHRHSHDYVTIFLGESNFSNEVEGKAPVTLKLPDGETRFSKTGI